MIPLGPDDVPVAEVPRGRLGGGVPARVTSALDAEISAELAAEGITRGVVRAVQQAQRDAGLDSAERIALTIAGSDSAQAAMREHHKFIAHGDARDVGIGDRCAAPPCPARSPAPAALATRSGLT